MCVWSAFCHFLFLTPIGFHRASYVKISAGLTQSVVRQLVDVTRYHLSVRESSNFADEENGLYSGGRQYILNDTLNQLFF